MKHKVKDWEKWSSAGNEMIMCPHENCIHTGHVITKAHCRMEHGMEREEVQKLYGFPKRVIRKNITFIKGDK